jgi:uncharacterized protein (DUF1499 family)
MLTTGFLFSCSGTRPLNLGVSDSEFTACPDTPNCVSSDALDVAHKVQPYQFETSPEQAWQLAREMLLKLPRTRIVDESEGYLHAECQSAFFGFVDDVELHLRKDEKTIAVRSASRLGKSDFGVNKKRVEQLRLLLLTAGFIR